MNIKIIETWNGDNYQAIVSAIVGHNTEIRIKVQGKKLIIKDPSSDFYRCIPKGDPVEIPDTKVIEDDPQIVEEIPEKTLPSSCSTIMTEAQRKMYIEWGLLKK